MKKILVIALACGLFSATATFAQTAKSAPAQKATASQTSSKATAKAETKHACTEAEMKECKDHGKKSASCCSHDSKTAAGKSSCCMKGGKTEAKAESKEEKKEVKQ